MLVAIALLTIRALSQVPTSPTLPAGEGHLSFQVATIKPSKPDELMTIQIRGRRFATTAATLTDVLKYCYGIHSSQVVGGPDWIRKEKFDILAEPNDEVRPSSEEMKAMVRELLANRFHLAFRRAKKELPVYAIMIAKNGPRLITETKDSHGFPSVSYSSGWLTARNSTIDDLAIFLQRYVTDRPVVNQTTIAGKYNIELHWTTDDLSLNGSVSKTKNEDHSWPVFFTAIQEQLGLKLKAVKAPAEVLLIKDVAMPTEN